MNHDPSDASVLSRFTRGDPEALGILAARYEASLFGLARGLLNGNDDLAREAVQECWVRVIRHAERFRGDSAVRTWIYRILVNRCLDARAREARSAHNAANAEALGFDQDFLDPADAATSADLGTQVAHIVQSLPEPMRVVLILCYHRGLTHQQSAEVLGIPVGTLKTRLHAALNRLRESLTPEKTT